MHQSQANSNPSKSDTPFSTTKLPDHTTKPEPDTTQLDPLSLTESIMPRHNSYYLLLSLLISLSNSIKSEPVLPNLIKLKLVLPNSNTTNKSEPVHAQDIVGTSSDTCKAPDPDLYFRPVIGILTHPGDGAGGRLDDGNATSFIAASYVKFVESAGARVIPMVYNEPVEVLLKKLSLVNGVLLTGGWCKTGLYFDTVKMIFEKTLERNKAGDRFPLFAICLGFELLSMVISKNNDILERFSASNQASTLQFYRNPNIEGTVFQRFPLQLLQKLTTDCLIMQNHNWGLSPKTFEKNAALANFFRIITTTKDGDNKVYISTVQAKNYPVTAFQWHPEKNAFEWGSSMIPHSEEAIQVTQYAANFFISESRKSLNRPPTRDVLDNLIYNYSPTYCGKAGKGYDEVYLFSSSL